MADEKNPAEETPAVKRRQRKSAASKPAHDGVADAVAESLSELPFAKPEPAELTESPAPALPATYLLFQEPDPTHTVRRPAADEDEDEKKPRRRGSRGRGKSGDESESGHDDSASTPKGSSGKGAKKSDDSDEKESAPKGKSDRADKSDRGSNRGRGGSSSNQDTKKSSDSSNEKQEQNPSDSPDKTDQTEPVTRRRRRRRSSDPADEVTALKGSTRLEAKRQRRREGREAGRRRHSVTESEFLARRESVDRTMLVREQNGLNQIAVIEDGILVEHYVARHTQVSMVGNVYLGRVQNVLPSMEAAFVDIGKGRNAVLYAGEVNWDAVGMEGKPRRIEQALKSGDTVLVQVTKDPIGHKGARLTGQVTLAGRHLVLVPSGAMTGISRKLPENERQRLKKLLREIVPAEHGVIVRTAAEGATEEQLRNDVERLTKRWASIEEKSKKTKSAPTLLKGEPELAVRVVRDVFNEDFGKLEIQGKGTYQTIKDYVHELSPELDDRVHHWVKNSDIFAENRVDEQLAKAMDRKVFLPSGGSLVIDRTEAMTVVDVNTGKFTGSGGTLEETVTNNNLEAAEEIVRQLRLRDIGGIIVIDFIDMVLESNRDLVLRRLIECLGRDRTRHQVAEVTSLGLVQMTRKRVGQGLVEAFSTTCEACDGRGFHTHTDPVEKGDEPRQNNNSNSKANNSSGQRKKSGPAEEPDAKREEVRAALASIAKASHHAEHKEESAGEPQEKTTHDSQPQSGRQASDRKDKASQRRGRGSGKPDTTGAGAGQSAPTREPAEDSKARESKATSPAEKRAAEAAATDKSASEEPKKPRRVSSTGTIVPKSSSSRGIMTFPVS